MHLRCTEQVPVACKGVVVHVLQLAGLVGQTHPTEPRDWQLKLTLAVARLLNERIVCWGRVEKTAQPLFFMAERNGRDCKAGRRQGALP